MSGLPTFLIEGQPNRKLTGSLRRSQYRWKKVTGTSHGTPGTQTTHAHGLGRTPRMVIFEKIANDVSIYESAAADGTNISVKSSAATQSFTAWVI